MVMGNAAQEPSRTSAMMKIKRQVKKMLTTEPFTMNSLPGQTMMPSRSNACDKGRQQGAVLVVGLILLMVITLLALAGIQGVSLQERMSGNAYDRNIAFNAAEIGLRWAEHKLLLKDDSAFGAIHDAGDATYDDEDDPKFDTDADVTMTDKVPQPKVAVIDLGASCYKVNSLGTGRSSKTQVILQSIVCRD
jgi:type IV pilus assembly protein PilX